MCENGQITKWCTTKYLQEKVDDENYAIVVLNRPISIATFPKLWNKGKIFLKA